MTDDMTAWLRGVLDEDEREAQKHPDGEDYPIVGLNAEKETGYPSLPYLRIAKAFALADIAAKRAILDLALRDVGTREFPSLFPHLAVEDCWYSCPKSTEGSCNDDEGTECNCGADFRRDRLVRLLASAYADRPGYREEWRP